MKRQTVILAAVLIAVFATSTILADVSAAQRPIAPTTKIATATKDNQNLRGPQYYPPHTYWYFPPQIITPGHPPINPPPIWRE